MRPASHSHTWYSADPVTLASKLGDSFLSAGTQTMPTKAIITPHAGFRYSGQTASWAYRTVDPARYTRVFVIGPCHHQYVEGCALPESSMIEYATPLGNLPLDVDVIRELKSQQEVPFKTFSQHDDEEEHSIEMQLPLIRYTFKSNSNVRIVPLYVGSLVQNEERLYGRLLSKYFDDPSTLFVVSSDFCHWGHRFRFTPREFPQKLFPSVVFPQGSMNGNIESLDRQAMELIGKQDCEGFYKYLQSTGNTICGRHPILVLLETMRHAQMKVHMEFIHYSQSTQLPDVVSRDDSCVSYAAGVAWTQ